jgi:aralkylamine N-acetyltransferase
MYKYIKEIPDINKYYSLYLETGWNEILKLSKDEVLKALKGSYLCLCVYTGDTLVGFGRINSDGVIYAGLFDVMVKQTYQNQRIGQTIVKKLVEHCELNGIRSIHLFSASGKREFYEKLSFEARPANMPGMKYIQ